MPRSELGLPLIAATASPRRRELLLRFWPRATLNFQVPEYDEDIVPAAQSDPHKAVGYLTEGKMAALCRQFDLPAEYLALTADTLVFCAGKILGKPADEREARAMLRGLSGRTHSVITGLCLQARINDVEKRLLAREITSVTFAPLSSEQIDWYIATGEPFDKAGAYGIQGCGAVLVEKITGCYYNVMGLPVFRLMHLLQQMADQFSSSPHLTQLLPWT